MRRIRLDTAQTVRVQAGKYPRIDELSMADTAADKVHRWGRDARSHHRHWRDMTVRGVVGCITLASKPLAARAISVRTDKR